jgi:hypothetical protein
MDGSSAAVGTSWSPGPALCWRLQLFAVRCDGLDVRLVATLAVTLTIAAPALAGRGLLPPTALRGPENRLHQYPTISLATPEELAAAKRLRAELRHSVHRWPTPRAAKAAGFDTRRVRRTGDPAGFYLHAEHRRNSNDHLYLDPRRPEALIYANPRGRPLVLIGVMFSVPRGVHGATPGGPITRWHTHQVCARGTSRGRAPRRDGTCPRGTRLRQGSEMLHFWLTQDLRSAFAIHAPPPELCRDGLLAGDHCRHRGHHGNA